MEFLRLAFPSEQAAAAGAAGQTSHPAAPPAPAPELTPLAFSSTPPPVRTVAASLLLMLEASEFDNIKDFVEWNNQVHATVAKHIVELLGRQQLVEASVYKLYGLDQGEGAGPGVQGWGPYGSSSGSQGLGLGV